MKNLIKGVMFAAFALSFAACKNDKPASETATTTTEATTTTDPNAVATSMATTQAAPETQAAPSSGVAAVSKAAVEPVKPASAQTTPAAAAPAAAPAGKTTVIKFDELTYAWGSVNEGDKMKHTFKFKNTGSNDLIISNAHGSCGCTVPEWPKEPIKPGKTGEIKVVFDSKGKPGDQQKTVTLTANTDPANTVLTIKGAVKPAAQ